MNFFEKYKMMITNIIGEIFILIIFGTIALKADLGNLIYVIAFAFLFACIMSNIGLYLIIKKREKKLQADSELEQTNTESINDPFNK